MIFTKGCQFLLQALYLPDFICTVNLYLFSSAYFCGLKMFRLFVGNIQLIIPKRPPGRIFPTKRLNICSPQKYELENKHK